MSTCGNYSCTSGGEVATCTYFDCAHHFGQLLSRATIAQSAIVARDDNNGKADENDVTNRYTTPHTTTIRPFFRDHPDEPVPEENFWTLWCKGTLTEADTLTIGLGTTPSGLTSAHLHHPPIFYRPDALPAAQPQITFTENFMKFGHVF